MKKLIFSIIFSSLIFGACTPWPRLRTESESTGKCFIVDTAICNNRECRVILKEESMRVTIGQLVISGDVVCQMKFSTFRDDVLTSVYYYYVTD